MHAGMWALSSLSVESGFEGAPSQGELRRHGPARTPRGNNRAPARSGPGRRRRGSNQGAGAGTTARKPAPSRGERPASPTPENGRRRAPSPPAPNAALPPAPPLPRRSLRAGQSRAGYGPGFVPLHSHSPTTRPLTGWYQHRSGHIFTSFRSKVAYALRDMVLSLGCCRSGRLRPCVPCTRPSDQGCISKARFPLL